MCSCRLMYSLEPASRIDPRTIAFLFEGRRLRPEQTPLEVCIFLSLVFKVKLEILFLLLLSLFWLYQGHVFFSSVLSIHILFESIFGLHMNQVRSI